MEDIPRAGDQEREGSDWSIKGRECNKKAFEERTGFETEAIGLGKAR